MKECGERQKLRVSVSVRESTQLENWPSAFEDKRQFCYDLTTQIENF